MGGAALGPREVGPTRYHSAPMFRWLMFLLAALASSCAVSGRVVVRDDTTAYKATWSQNWTRVIAAATAWQPADGKPGPCDKGGDANACYATDQRVLPVLRTLRSELAATNLPDQYRAAHEQIIAAIDTNLAALAARDEAFRQNDNALFAHAIRQLQAAAALFVKGYALFPSDDRPTPQPFGGGRLG